MVTQEKLLGDQTPRHERVEVSERSTKLPRVFAEKNPKTGTVQSDRSLSMQDAHGAG